MWRGASLGRLSKRKLVIVSRLTYPIVLPIDQSNPYHVNSVGSIGAVNELLLTTSTLQRSIFDFNPRANQIDDAYHFHPRLTDPNERGTCCFLKYVVSGCVCSSLRIFHTALIIPTLDPAARAQRPVSQEELQSQ